MHLVDAVAARFGEFDDTYLVGLVETDWAERQRRSFFYSSVLLKALGWPQDDDQRRAQQAAFRDVLTLARHRTRLSAFQLEGDAIVALSPMVEAARGLPGSREAPAPRGGLFPGRVLTREPPLADLPRRRPRWLGAPSVAPGPVSTHAPTAGSWLRASRPTLPRQPRRPVRRLSVQVLRRARAGPAARIATRRRA